MASPLNEPEGRTARRLVLRPVEQDQPSGPGAVSVSSDDQVWELADPWGSPQPEAVAMTHRLNEMVTLVSVATRDDAPDATKCLVQQLVAALRRTDAAVITSSIEDTAVRRELLSVGFVPLPEEPDSRHLQAVGSGSRLILQL